MNNKVSVIVPFYNQDDYIKDTIYSLYNQDYDNFEIIIVNDGSTSIFSEQILSEFSDRCLILNKENGGLSSARNYGIRHADGEYIICLDSDDIVEPNFISALVLNLESDDNFVISYSNGFFFDERNGPWFLLKPDLKDIIQKNSIYCSALFRKKQWEDVGGYNEQLKRGWEDWDFWISILSQGGAVVKTSKALFKYRIRNQSMARKMDIEYRKFAANEMFIRNKKIFIENNISVEDIIQTKLSLWYKIKWRIYRLIDTFRGY